jgi:ABC-type transport system involved in multi-copper enzyme maturation permease subunit
VQRELRVSSRRKSTYYVRAAAAMLGIVIGFFMLLMLTSPAHLVAAGNYMFTFLSWYALLTTLLAGVFLASDSLSEERREGTLGLLFLTDLKGYDVVLGKFMAVSLNAFYGLLAVFPVLALCLLSGGVSGAGILADLPGAAQSFVFFGDGGDAGFVLLQFFHSRHDRLHRVAGDMAGRDETCLGHKACIT